MSAPRTDALRRGEAGTDASARLGEAGTDPNRHGGTGTHPARHGGTGTRPAHAGEPGPDAFRLAARRWTSGVALLTARHGEEVFAKTVSSLCTLSLDPLLVSVAVSARSPLTAAVRADGRYAVAVLARHQEPVARRFAAPGAGRALGLFTAAPMLPRATGAPVLEDCLAWFDCRLHSVLPGGDHTVLVGRVAAADAVPGEPLIYHHGEYRSLAGPPTPPTGART
ncbi:flavin reductase family protein [Streptomyces sp. NPDC005017]|uniref:flavin reductase family protein n=1 Tax=Streptomyces sp. NPDC005017 TaxID=3364706 RepID=UPI00367DB539